MSVSTLKPTRDMTKGSILPQLFFFALPIIATNVLQLLFNTADTIVVGRWGGSTPEDCELALAAVGSCGSLINLLISLFTGLSVGAGVCVAHHVGAREYDKIEKTVHTAALTAIVCGLVSAAIGIMFANPMLVLMGTEKNVIDQATAYMQAYFCGIPANMLYLYCAAMLRSTGDSTRPLIFLSTAGVVNVVLNLITVLGLGLGAIGVGIATAASHWVSCILIIAYMCKNAGPCHFEFKKLAIDRAQLLKILKIGVPAGISSSVFSISNVIIQSAINSFEDTAIISGNMIGTNVCQYTMQTVGAVSQSALTFVGQNVGAKYPDRIKRGVVWCSVIIFAIGLAVSTLIFIFSDFLLGLYAPENPMVVEYGKMRILYVGMFYCLCGLVDCGACSLRGLGRSTASMVISLIGVCGLRVVWIYTAFAHFRTLQILYFSYPFTWIVTSIAQYAFFAYELRKFRKNVEQEKLSEIEEAA